MNEKSEVLEPLGPLAQAACAAETETALPPDEAAVGNPVEAPGVAPAAAEAPCAESATACSAGPALAEIAAATREAVSQAMARSLSDLNQLGDSITRLPNPLRSGLESSFSVLLERIEDPKGLVSFNRQRRLFLDLLVLYDMMGDLESSVEGDAPQRGNYRTLKEQLAQTLAMSGVTPIATLAGAAFNPQQHRAVRVAPASAACGDGCIDTVVRDGFAFGAFVLRPTEVVVARLASAPNGGGGGNG